MIEVGRPHRLVPRIEVHGNCLPIAAMSEVDPKHAGVVPYIRAPVLQRHTVVTISIAVNVGDPIGGIEGSWPVHCLDRFEHEGLAFAAAAGAGRRERDLAHRRPLVHQLRLGERPPDDSPDPATVDGQSQAAVTQPGLHAHGERRLAVAVKNDGSEPLRQAVLEGVVKGIAVSIAVRVEVGWFRLPDRACDSGAGISLASPGQGGRRRGAQGQQPECASATASDARDEAGEVHATRGERPVARP